MEEDTEIKGIKRNDVTGMKLLTREKEKEQTKNNEKQGNERIKNKLDFESEKKEDRKRK